MRVLRELLVRVLAVDRLEPLDQRREVVRVEVRILRARELRFLRLVERSLEGVRRHVHHDLAEHLDEPAVGVAREPHIALGLLRETHHRPIVQSEVEDRVHHPGHRELRAGSDRDEERVVGIAEALVHRLLEPAEMLAGLLQHLGRRTARPGGTARQASVVIVNPGGTGRPMFVISARLAPLPPRRSFMSLLPSEKS